MLANRPVHVSYRRLPSVVHATAPALALMLALSLGPVRPAHAQLTMDPYNIVGEYNRQYLPYIYATEPVEGSFFPNQGRLQERPGRSAKQYRSELNNIEESDLGEPGSGGPSDRGSGFNRRLSGPGVPYYKAYRQFDQQFQREYRPNYQADRDYYRQKEKQNDEYFRALREDDPKKRAKMLRQFSVDRLQTSRQLSGGRTAAGKIQADARERDRFAPGDDPDSKDGATARPLGSPLDRPRAGRFPAGRNPEEDDGRSSPLRPGTGARPLDGGLRGIDRRSTLENSRSSLNGGPSPFRTSVPRVGASALDTEDDEESMDEPSPRPGVRSPRLPSGLPDSLGSPRIRGTPTRGSSLAPGRPGSSLTPRSSSDRLRDAINATRRPAETPEIPER